MTIDYTQLKAPISREALSLSTKLLNDLLDHRVSMGRMSEEAVEEIKKETVYQLMEALEEGQHDIWLENMRANHEG
tara:strand:+ start:235 stop:462 length:228 start_codon:yes stop_codon:yes gene_type:complete